MDRYITDTFLSPDAALEAALKTSSRVRKFYSCLLNLLIGEQPDE